MHSSSDGKTHFFDLKYDILLLICEQLNVNDLLSLIDAAEQFSWVVEHVWRCKNAKKLVIFIPYESMRKIEESAEIITVDSSDYGQKVVRHFGHLMTKISIEYNRPFEMDSNMFQLINSYCSESLIQLHIEQFAFFEEFKKPFNKVQSISLKGDFTSTVSPSLRFNEMFPSLRSIRWEMVNTTALCLNNEKLPHLEEIDGNIMSNEAENTFKNLINNHRSQIRGLNLNIYRRNFLEFVANEMSSFEELTKLEYLHMKLSQEQVTFTFSFNSKSTRRFNLTGDSVENLITTNTFGDLVEFDAWSIFNKYGKQAIPFLPIHKNSLKKLRLQPKVDNDDILQLANAEMNFIEIELFFCFGIEVNSLIQLLEKSKCLKRVILHTSDCNGIDYFSTKYDDFERRLPNDWHFQQKHLYQAGYYQLEHKAVAGIEADDF